MALTLSTAARNGSCNGATATIDAGTAAGKIVFKSAADVVLCTITLAKPAFGAASVGTATAAGLPKSGTGAVAAGTGITATKFDVTDSDDNVVWSGTIPSNMTLDNASIASGQIVSVTSWTHSQPAS